MNSSTHFNQFGDQLILKLIQHSDERSEHDLDGGPSKAEPDLLVWEDLKESERERERKERLDKIKEERAKLNEMRIKLDEIKDKLDEIKEDRPSLIDSLRIIFSWRNYSVYLTTAWTFSAFSYLGLFFNLYFLDLFPGEYVFLGAILSSGWRVCWRCSKQKTSLCCGNVHDGGLQLDTRYLH
ncbi:MAG: hypothetical protein ACFFEE_04290 [Candidatus Thorarchaeota archaeon]